MQICNQEREVLEESSNNMWACYMSENYGLQYSRTWDDSFLLLYSALASTSLDRRLDMYYTNCAKRFMDVVEILAYPTQSVEEIDYPN